VLLAFFTGASLADEMPTFQQLDADSDKMLNIQEVETVLSGINFSEADTNKDGLIDEQEFTLLLEQLRRVDVSES
jgi:hypothetical protein